MNKTLPIWRDANRLLLDIENSARHWPRYHKYILGAEEGYLKGGLKRRTMRLCWWPERTLMSAGFSDPVHAPQSAPLVLTGAIP